MARIKCSSKLMREDSIIQQARQMLIVEYVVGITDLLSYGNTKTIKVQKIKTRVNLVKNNYV